ncbi:hypothetical protein [Vibrio sp. AND4]|nr:hypothetical protein [Vibrio sp. AND4]EDP60319.1 hypothetical protein AND4_02883 [Vibrio sp. AND4]
MERLITRKKIDSLIPEVLVDWLTQVPTEITSLWIPNECGINEELV